MQRRDKSDPVAFMSVLFIVLPPGVSVPVSCHVSLFRAPPKEEEEEVREKEEEEAARYFPGSSCDPTPPPSHPLFVHFAPLHYPFLSTKA